MIKTKQLILIFLVCISCRSFGQDDQKQKAVRNYYAGFANHDWNLVRNQLADGFRFTTPVNDHIAIDEFRETCWGTNKFFKTVNLVSMTESGENLILLVEINTTDNKVVRNVDIYTFQEGKIKTAEVFFGPGVSYPGNKN